MAVKYAQLNRIDGSDVITQEANSEFLYNLQWSLLLALRDRGKLNDMQYRYAQEKLKQQRRDRAGKMLEQT